MTLTKTLVINKGSDLNLVYQMKDPNTGLPLSLVGLTGATGYFPKDGGGSIAASGSLSPTSTSKVVFAISDADTAQMAAGEEQSLEVVVDVGATRYVNQDVARLRILDRIY